MGDKTMFNMLPVWSHPCLWGGFRKSRGRSGKLLVNNY